MNKENYSSYKEKAIAFYADDKLKRKAKLKRQVWYNTESAIAYRKRYWKHLMPPHPRIKVFVLDDGIVVGTYPGGSEILGPVNEDDKRWFNARD